MDGYHEFDQRLLELLSAICTQVGQLVKRERMEQSLRISESQLRNSFDSSAIGVGLAAPDGRWLKANRVLCEIVGYTEQELLNASMEDITHAEDAELHRQNVRSLLASEARHCHVQQRYVHKDGRTVWGSLSMSLVRDDAGCPLYLIYQLQDVTEQRHLEALLRHAQKMESIGQLAAGIAHEINTPTQYIGDNNRFLRDAFANLSSVVLQLTQRLSDVVPGDEDASSSLLPEGVTQSEIDYLLAEIPQAIEQSLEGIQRVADIVGAMKEFAHPGVPEKTAIDLNRAIQSTITVARNEWKYVADLATELAPGLPLVVCVPGEINQVVLNLIVNAAHAIGDMIERGTFKKGAITVGTRHDGDWVEIRVADNGTGIPPHVRANIFDPFFSTKAVGKGTGQGLAISHSVVKEKHGGSINFETELGVGTTFIVRLPISPDVPATAGADVSWELTQSGPTPRWMGLLEGGPC
jgi:PAS domain S-box-containing protein